jgi:hypothetical protein
MADIRHSQVSFLDRIGRVIHDTLDTVPGEPIPERWTDLLERLNAEEDAQLMLRDGFKARRS